MLWEGIEACIVSPVSFSVVPTPFLSDKVLDESDYLMSSRSSSLIRSLSYFSVDSCDIMKEAGFGRCPGSVRINYSFGALLD